MPQRSRLRSAVNGGEMMFCRPSACCSWRLVRRYISEFAPSRKVLGCLRQIVGDMPVDVLAPVAVVGRSPSHAHRK